MTNPRYAPEPVWMNPSVSVLLIVVVSVGAEPPAHRMPENHVTVRVPVPSCLSARTKARFDVMVTARVRLPPSVTDWMPPLVSMLKVIVEPSLSAYTVLAGPAAPVAPVSPCAPVAPVAPVSPFNPCVTSVVHVPPAATVPEKITRWVALSL